MKTNALIVLDTRVKKADGTFPLIMRIVHNRKSSQIPLGLSLHLKDWDDTKHLIKSSYNGTESVTRLNNQHRKKVAEALDIISKLDEKKTLQTLTITQLKELIEKSNNLSFFKYTENMIADMKKTQRFSSARSYEGVISVLRTFSNNRELTFTDITHSFLVKLEQHHIIKGNSLNGLAVYMRTIRAVFNNAIKAKLVERDLYPFTNYKIKTKKTRKRAISATAIKAIEKMEFEPNHPLYNSHNYFMFCFYTRGMPFADMAHLQWSNLIDGRIIYERQKTDKPYTIKITENVQHILDKYPSEEKDDFIFPIITTATPEEQYRQVKWARSMYNKKLKKIAILCGIQENLTSYVSRHSFATIAKHIQIPIADISDMLGHESIKTTQIYLDTLPNKMIDDATDLVMSAMQKTKQPNTKTKKRAKK